MNPDVALFSNHCERRPSARGPLVVRLAILTSCALLVVSTTLSMVGCPLPEDDGGVVVVVDAGPDEAPRVRLVGGPIASPDDAPAHAFIEDNALPDGVLSFVFDVVGTGPDGASGTIVTDVRPTTRGVTFLAFSDEGVVVIPTFVRDGAGATLLTTVPPANLSDAERTYANGFPGQLWSPVRALPQTSNAAFHLPMSPETPLVVGALEVQWGTFVVDKDGQFPVASASTRPLAIQVLVDDRPEVDERRPILDIIVHIAVDGIDVESDGGILDPALTAGLGGLVAAYDRVGIDVEVRDVQVVSDPSFRTITLDDDTCANGDLSELFDTARGDASSMALHLYFVERFECLIAGGIQVGDGIAGIAAGIPGVGPASANTHGGVAVAWGFFSDDPDRFGVVVAHETTHFLGLFHTKESPRTGVRPVVDLIADTGEELPDARANLMYFAAGTDNTLSVGQAHVIAHHPLVRP